MASGDVRGVTLIERATVCKTGGGFEETRWRPRVNDGWMRLDLLLRRGPDGVGDVVAERLLEDDPNEVAAHGWSDLAPGMWFRRETYVTAPIGTRFWRRLWVPNRELAREKPLRPGVPYTKYDRIYELLGEEKLVPVDVLEAQVRTRSARVEKLARPEEIRSTITAILTSLANPTLRVAE
jgi:hypothetical protein